MALVNTSKADFSDIGIYLDEYSRTVNKLVEETIYKVSKEGAKRLKEKSPRSKGSHSGTYAKGWAAKQEKGGSRFAVKESIIYAHAA